MPVCSSWQVRQVALQSTSVSSGQYQLGGVGEHVMSTGGQIAEEGVEQH